MKDEVWVIEGKPDGTMPEVGHVYEIQDFRKGNFVGRIISVTDNFADVEVTKGRPHFASVAHNLDYEGHVSIRASLCVLTEIQQEKED